jgi:hypothetical protein
MLNHPTIGVFRDNIIIINNTREQLLSESNYKVSIASLRSFNSRIVIQKVIIKCVISGVARSYFRFIFVTRFKIPNT